MSDRINGFSLYRFAAAATVLLATLAGCNRTEPSIYGFVDVVPSSVRQTACESPSGALRLDGMQAGDVVTIAADELCHNWIVRKELPAGLYTVSWQTSGEEGDPHGVDLAGRAVASDPVIVNVFPEQTTTLRVHPLEAEPALLCQATSDGA